MNEDKLVAILGYGESAMKSKNIKAIAIGIHQLF